MTSGQWKIEWEHEAVVSLSMLEIGLARRIRGKILEASKNPHHYFKKLVGEDYYKLRIGDYRVLAILFPSSSIISIEKVGHRKNIYDL